MFTEKEIKELIFKSIERSEDYLSEDSPQIAEAILIQLLKINPDNFEAMQLLGLALYKQDKYKEAICIFEKSLKGNPNNAENHNNIGLCYSFLHKFRKAIKHAKRAGEIK